MRAAPSPPSGPRSCPLESPAIQKTLGALLEGYDYAQDLKSDPWEFALGGRALLVDGCTRNALRWLVQKGYVTQKGAGGKRAAGGGRRSEENGTIPEVARFILTEAGAAVARAACPRPSVVAPTDSPPKGRTVKRAVPAWDPVRGELRFEGLLVRRFRNAASHQRAVLDAFERAGWPEWLADPLPPTGLRGNRKRRLADVVKNLNRDHATRSLHFYVTDCGRAAGWRRLG